MAAKTAGVYFAPDIHCQYAEMGERAADNKMENGRGRYRNASNEALDVSVDTGK